jgi:hypothetical protein
VGHLSHALASSRAESASRARRAVEAEEAVAQLDALCTKAHAELAEHKRKLAELVRWKRD